VNLVLSSAVVWFCAGLLALAACRVRMLPSWLGAGGGVVAAVLGMAGAVPVLMGHPATALHWAWSVPFGSFHLDLDALSAWFLVPVSLLAALCALSAFGSRRGAAADPWGGATWFWYTTLVAGMILVLTARNAILFLMAWEGMSIASFFLVTRDHEREEVRRAGWIYLVATHVGTACLLALFVVLGRETGSMDFDTWGRFGELGSGVGGAAFLLALVGFGTKAGLMPFHIWLPEAHPAAPSPVSALMSGAMIKTGVYGLLRMLWLLGQPSGWWGWVLLSVGIVTGAMGVVLALAQHDLKRSLAYSSVENVGLIVMGLGLGVLGRVHDLPNMALLGFAAAMLHVWNHGIIKALLFLGAGSVLHATGTRRLDELGGLMKRMPWTGAAFVVGAAAIAGLPLFNGFVSEWLLFLGAWGGVATGTPSGAIPGVVVVVGLALIGGLAAACFTRLAGVVFLGEPRSPAAATAHETQGWQRGTLVTLATLCVALGLAAPWVVRWAGTAATLAADVAEPTATRVLDHTARSATTVVWVMLAVAGFALVMAVARRGLLRRREVETSVTWDCGYAQPTARMQYTASSFAQPLLRLFSALMRRRQHLEPPEGFFPTSAAFQSEVSDPCQGEIYEPAFERLNRAMARLRWLQQGKVQLYVLYLALTLFGLLIWKLG
jgi:hydrogenase-4 component B